MQTVLSVIVGERKIVSIYPLLKYSVYIQTGVRVGV